MGKNQSASGLTNIIQYDNNGNVSFVSGSTTLMQISSSGAITTTGVISGSNALSSSYALNSGLLNSTGSVGFATTASLLEVSSSQQQISASQQQLSSSFLTLTASYTALSSSYTALSGSYNTFSGSNSTILTAVSSSNQQLSASYISLSGSYNTFSGSASTRVTQIEQVYATTGSNSFRADQSITGSLVVSSTITAQTLVVQTVTSSIIYSSGSNNFGNQLANTQTFTGSVNITGSITQTGVNTTSSFSGNVGIGITTPSAVLHTSGVTKLGGGNLHVSSDQTFITSNSYTFRDAMGINNPNSVSYPVSSNYTVAIGSSGGGGSLLTAGPIYSSGSITVSVINYPQLVLNSSNNNGPQLRFQGCGSNTSVIGHISSVSDLQFSSTSSLAVQMNLSQAGNLSIGSILQFDSNGDFYQKTTGAAAIWSATANVTYPSYGFYGNTGIGMYRASAGVLAFTTSACERMRISCGGNVGIGTSSPFAIADVNLTVNGPTGAAIQLGYNGTRYGQFYAANDEVRLSAVANLPLTFYSNNLERMRITSTGITCFACQVCAPAFVGGTISGTSISGTSIQVTGQIARIDTIYLGGGLNGSQNTAAACYQIESAYALASCRTSVSRGSQYGGTSYYILLSAGQDVYVYYKLALIQSSYFCAWAKFTNAQDGTNRTGISQYSFDNGGTWSTLGSATFGAGSGTAGGGVATSSGNYSGVVVFRAALCNGSGNGSLIGIDQLHFMSCGYGMHFINNLG